MAVENDPLIGRLVADQYRIASRLGTGAMATIYRARDQQENVDVALKIVKPAILKNKTAAARFHREAKAASRLRHEGIVAVKAWGFDGDLPYIAMELVEGEDIFELLDRRGALKEEEALRVVIALCGALHTAHQEGIVHRDLKPENIMVGGLDDDGDGPVHIKVLDFGIAKMLGPRAGDMWGDETVPQALTKVGSAVGTPSHMAPEQARGDEVDGRTDIYAVGVLLYEMVTGHLPFEGDNPLHVAIRQVRDPPPPPTSHNPDLHPELEAIILKMLEKEPDARYQTVAELERALRNVLSDVEPDHQTAQRSIPTELPSDPEASVTAQRDIAPPESDDDYEMATAQRPIPLSLRGISFKKKPPSEDEPATRERPFAPQADDDDDPLTNVVRKALDSYEDPSTVEMETVAGKTMRRKVQDKMRAALAKAVPAGPSSTEVTLQKQPVIPRPDPAPAAPIETARSGERPAAEHEEPLPEPPPPGEHPYDIEDEDSEEVIPTVVADPNNLTGSAARVVLEARAIAEAALSTQERASQRSAAVSVTKQSDFGALGDSGPGPSVEVIAVEKDATPAPPGSFSHSGAHAGASPGPYSGSHPASLGADSGVGQRKKSNTITANLPIDQWQGGAGPATRGAANELEDLLKQMPRQRQPVVGSVVVLIFLAIAIVALVYLLVGVATF